MNIGNYIKDLLFQHDCVIIPGFGGFVANYQPAEVHKYRNVIYAPSKSIMFNRQLVHNDGLLITHVAQQEQLDYKTAEKKVKAFAAVCKNNLSENGVIKLLDVGKLYYNSQKILIFLPELRKNFLPESFGLKPISFASNSNTDNAYQIKTDSSNSGKATIPRSKKLSYVGVAATLILALAVSQFILWDLAPERFQFNNINFGGTSSTDKISEAEALPIPQPVLADSSSLTNFEVKEQEVVEQTSEEPETEVSNTVNKEIESPNFASTDELNQSVTSVTDDDPINEEGYYLIYGSFKSSKNANKLKKGLEYQGKRVKLMKSKNGYVRVGAFAGTNKSDANLALSAAQSEANSSIWMIYSN